MPRSGCHRRGGRSCRCARGRGAAQALCPRQKIGGPHGVSGRYFDGARVRGFSGPLSPRETVTLPLPDGLVRHSAGGCDNSQASALDGGGHRIRFAHAGRIEPKVTLRQALIVLGSTPILEPMVTDDERAAFSRRLNEACDDAGLPAKGQGRQLAVAKLFHVTQKGARKWLEGEAVPHTKRLPQIAERLGVTVEWLLTGAAPKKAGAASDTSPGHGVFSREELEFAALARQLPPAMRRAWRASGDALAASTRGNDGTPPTAPAKRR